MKVLTHDYDGVVSAVVSLATADYDYALKMLLPLINQLKEQRSVQNPKFYTRLERDILQRCLMPPITLAFVRPNPRDLNDVNAVTTFINENISDGFILDGIQRLSALSRARAAAETRKIDFPINQSLFINIIICPSVDNLLYRMITLNNGQKPMTARHQVEILASNAFDFQDSSVKLATEKNKVRKTVGVFSKGDFELGYMAFLSSSVNIDSQKLIQEKLDELLASRILERNPVEGETQFTDVLDLLARLSKDTVVHQWFKVANNLIGFCASVRDGYPALKDINVDGFRDFISRFEAALRSFNMAKIKLGRARREAVSEVTRRFAQVVSMDENEITELLARVIE